MPGTGGPSYPVMRSLPLLEIGAAASRLTGFVRAAVWAWALGLNLVGAAFAAGNAAPTALYILLVEGVVAVVLVPQLVAAAAVGPAHERRFTDSLLTVGVLGLLLLCGVAAATSPLLVDLYGGSGWSEAEVRLARLFALCCVPQLFFWGVHTLTGQVVGVRSGFAPMVWAPVLSNLVWILGGLAVGLGSGIDRGSGPGAAASVGSDDLVTVATIVAAASLAQAAVPVWVLHRSGFRWRWSVRLRGLGLGAAGRAVAWTCAYLAVIQVNGAVVSATTNTAAGADPDHAVGYPAFAAALTLALLPHAVVAVSRTMATFPTLSEAARRRDHEALARDLDAVLGRTVAVLVPTCVLLAALAEPVARLAYPGNPTDDVAAVATTLRVLALGTPFFSAFFVVVRAFYATSEGREPFLIQTVAAATAAAGALAALHLLPARHVLLAAAAAHSLACVAAAAHASRSFRRRFGVGVPVLTRTAQAFALSLPAGLVAAGAQLLGSDGPVRAALVGALGAVAFAATYGVSRWVLRVLRPAVGPSPGSRRRRRRAGG